MSSRCLATALNPEVAFSATVRRFGGRDHNAQAPATTEVPVGCSPNLQDMEHADLGLMVQYNMYWAESVYLMSSASAAVISYRVHVC